MPLKGSYYKAMQHVRRVGCQVDEMLLLGVTIHISADRENRHPAICDAEDIGELRTGRGGGNLCAAT